MFGGLEIKGASSPDAGDAPDNTPDTKGPEAGEQPPAVSSFGFMNAGPAAPGPAPAAPVSSFSFMNSAPAVAPEKPQSSPPGAAAGSSFSFMNASPAAPEPTPMSPANAAPAAAPAASGFSFMASEPTTPKAEPPVVESPSEVPPASPAMGMATTTATTTTTATATASSGFDFMNSMAAPAETMAPPAGAVGDTIIPTIAEEAPAAPPVVSGFSFLSDTAAPPTASEGTDPQQPDLPTAIHTRTNSHNSISSALSTPSLSSAPTPSPAVPAMTTAGGIAGAGITFGTSSSKPRIKKKKLRSQKIGIGASQSDATTTADAPVPTPAPAPPATEVKSARDEALEATKKAEAFMQSKAMEAAKSAERKPPPAATTTESVQNLGLEPSASTDEILAAAQEAAEKAKILQYQQTGKSSGGFMGTFFKGFRASPSTVGSAPMANSSKHSVGSSSNGSASGMDRLAKEQEVAKQAIAQRQLLQQQQDAVSKTIKEEDQDDDEVVVTTSVATSVVSTKPEEVATPAEPIKFTPATPSSASGISSFVPATIPSPFKPSATTSFKPAAAPNYGGIKVGAAPAPAQPKKRTSNTPKDIFEGYQEYFSQAVDTAMKKVEDARNTKKGLLEERFVALAKDRFATRELEQIEELQQVAIEEEDYEQADELGQMLDAHQREKSEVANMLKSNELALERLEAEKTSLGGIISSCFQDLASRLEELKNKELANEKQDDNETLTQYAAISKQLSDEHERLQQDLKHLERDEKLVAEERKELEGSINEQTGEIETEKEEAGTKLKEVEEEIEELRKLVESKQKEAANLRTKMFGFEDSIAKVRVKFARQLNRVNNKEMTVKQNRREWEIENDQYTKQKEAHDLQVESHSNALLVHEELLNTLESELKLSREFSEFTPAQLGFMEEESEAEEKDSSNEGSLAQLKANVVKCEGAVDAAKKSLKATTSAIQNLETERDGLAARIPELETQKKAAAAARDFKSAGKFSKEIKDATSRIQECEQELNGDAKAKKSAAEETLRQLDLDLLEAKKIADAEEKLSGEKRMATLSKKIEQLTKEKKERCGDASSEGNSVKCVGARLLESQIKMLMAEGSELGSKYGGWGDLVTSIGLEDAPGGVDSNESEANGGTSETAKEMVGSKLSEEELQARLAKAKELIAKSAKLEEMVQEAADRDDYEAAGELQEEVDKINSEIEEMNITDEECELLAQEETLLGPDPPAKEEEECGLTTEERVAKARELTTKQSELEQQVEAAAEIEDFEKAEEHQTSLDQINSELEELNLTDAERELLAKEEEAPASEEEEPLDEEEGEENVEPSEGGACEEEKKECPDEDECKETAEDEEKDQNDDDEENEKEPSAESEESEPVVQEEQEVPENAVEPSE
ncbi:unnamed protein product [Pseudo-nitzschia multistriata]|uniref:UVR domain-containing protein n=1 Tax=Pseudo-nitzschia multistriata TaxID=183589 RepID=A0A448YXQ4_9STRA|nr:unnamed protein product [Pseudo-nitzschia multistriata]